MGEPIQSPAPIQQQAICCCPVCGEDLTELPEKQADKCPNCAFNLTLVRLPHEPPVPPPAKFDIPRFAYLMLVIQAIFAAIIGVLFLFLASPLYFGIPLVIAIIQISSILIIALFLIVLRFPNAVYVARIGLIIFSMITLPLGVFAFAAAFSISIPQRHPTKEQHTGGTDGG